MTEPACTTHKTKADSQNVKNELTVAGGRMGELGSLGWTCTHSSSFNLTALSHAFCKLTSEPLYGTKDVHGNCPSHDQVLWRVYHITNFDVLKPSEQNSSLLQARLHCRIPSVSRAHL